jgi:hypothetical protein
MEQVSGGVLSKQKARTAGISRLRRGIARRQNCKRYRSGFYPDFGAGEDRIADLELRSGEAIIERVPVDRVWSTLRRASGR